MMDLSHDDLLRLYRSMLLARVLANHPTALGKIKHRQGNEAVTVGAALALSEGDIIMPQRHDVGAYLARGMSPEDMLTHPVIFGDMRSRLIAPPSHDAGKALAVAAGIALGTQLRDEQRVTLVYTDSAGAESADGYEALRFAALHHLPLVCIIEYAVTPHDDEVALLAFADRIAAFGVPTRSIDGGDALAVLMATSAALGTARNGLGPIALVARFARLALPGSNDRHILDDTNANQDDPIERLAAALIAHGVLTDECQAHIINEVAASVAAATVYQEQHAITNSARQDNTLFATADAPPLGPPLVPLRVAVAVSSESGEYRP